MKLQGGPWGASFVTNCLLGGRVETDEGGWSFFVAFLDLRFVRLKTNLTSKITVDSKTARSFKVLKFASCSSFTVERKRVPFIFEEMAQNGMHFFIGLFPNDTSPKVTVFAEGW